MNISPHRLCSKCKKLARKEHAKYMKNYRIKTQKQLKNWQESKKSEGILKTN